MSVCLLPMAGRTAGPIKTKLDIETHVDPGSVLVKVKVKVMWCNLVNANKTPDRGPQDYARLAHRITLDCLESGRGVSGHIRHAAFIKLFELGK